MKPPDRQIKEKKVLTKFVDQANWAYIDLTRTAYRVPYINYLGKTATGAGVRLLVEFLENFKK